MRDGPIGTKIRARSEDAAAHRGMVVHRRPVDRVAVVADNRAFGEALVGSLRRAGLTAAFCLPDADATAAVANELRPTVLLLVKGGDEDALLACVRTIRDVSSSVRVLLLVPNRVNGSAHLAQLANAAGILTLDVRLHDLVQAVKGVRTIPAAMERRPARPSPSGERGDSGLLERLTGRERQVLCELMGGASGEEIAAKLRISHNTVRTHVQNILTKLGAHTRLEAAAIGLQAGLRPSPRVRLPLEPTEVRPSEVRS